MNPKDDAGAPIASCKKDYETPLIAEHAAMNFPKEIWETFTDSSQSVLQCNHCKCGGHD